MGKIYNNLISTGAGFKYNAQQPLDDRAVVQSSSDLADLVNSNISYEGIEVYVVDDKKAYKLIGTEWKAIATEQYVNDASASVDEKITNKQDTLVSGENIKTVNGETLLGSGDITINVDLTSKPGEKTVDGGEIFNQYAPEYDDVYDTEGKVIGQQKVENLALSKYATAIGRGNIAGIKAFVILSYQDGTFVLDSVTGLAVGDVFSIKANESYINIGTIEYLNTDACSISIRINDGRNADWDNLEKKDFSSIKEKHLFIIDKPDIGTTSFDEGQYARGFLNRAILTGAYAEGYDNIAADRYAHTEGVHNIAYYAAHAEGYQTKALGDDSHSEGIGTQALGAASHAQGRDTTAKGVASFSTGIDTTAEGHYSTAVGKGTTAIGEATYAEGLGTVAEGAYAHAEGYQTKAAAISSHAEGEASEAHGKNSHVEGEGSWTSETGIDAHAEGSWTFAGHLAAHAEGCSTQAHGIASHAGGTDSKVFAHNGFVHGKGLIVNGDLDTWERPGVAFGQFNQDKKDLLFSIGNGSSDSSRMNAFEIYGSGYAKLPSWRKHYSDDAVVTQGALVLKYHVNNSGSMEGCDSAIKGVEIISDPVYSEIDGTSLVALVVDSFNSFSDISLEGKEVGLYYAQTFTPRIGTIYSVDNTSGTITLQLDDGVDQLIKRGASLCVNFHYSDRPTAYGARGSYLTDFSIAIGQETYALGQASFSEGRETMAAASYSHAAGYGSQAYGIGSHAGGNHSIARNPAQFVHGLHLDLARENTLPGAAAFGRYNNPNSPALFMIGNGEANSYSNAFEVFKDGHAELPALKNTDNELDATAIGESNFAVATKGYVDNLIQTLNDSISDLQAQVQSLQEELAQKTDVEINTWEAHD